MDDWPGGRDGFRVAVVLPMLYPESAGGGQAVLDAATAVAQDAFIDAIEVPPVADPVVRASLRALLTAAHIAPVYAAAGTLLGGGHDLGAPGERGVVAVALVRRMVSEAYDLGAGLMIVNSGPDPGADGRPAALGRLAAALGDVCRYARHEAARRAVPPLRLALEVFDRDVDKRLLIGPTAEAVTIADQVRGEDPGFGLALDLAHLVLLNEDPAASVAAAAGRISHVHLGNCCLEPGSPAWGDKHPPFGCPGGMVGAEDVAAFLLALKRARYFADAAAGAAAGAAAMLSFEVKPLPGDDPRLVLAGCRRLLGEAWSRLRRA